MSLMEWNSSVMAGTATARTVRSCGVLGGLMGGMEDTYEGDEEDRHVHAEHDSDEFKRPGVVVVCIDILALRLLHLVDRLGSRLVN